MSSSKSKMQTVLSVSVFALAVVTTPWIPTSEAFSTPGLSMPLYTTTLSRGSLSFTPSPYDTPPTPFTPFSLQTTASPTASEDDSTPPPPPSTTSKKAGMTNLTFNLVKSIVGAGVLSLPAGISAFGNAPSAMIPATILIAAIGGLSAFGFALIGRVCSYTGAASYREAWERTVGEETSVIPAAACTLKTAIAVLAYSMILADTFRSIFATAGLALSRTTTLLSITSAVILPLCLLKNLASLAPFSLLGVVGMGYTALAMAVRYAQGAYAAGGALLADVPAALAPTFGTVGARGVLNPSSSILIGMLSTAYMAHFNAPKFFNELEDNTIPRYNRLVGTSFGISVALFSLISGLGFLTFGSASSGLILNNYSNRDVLMSFSRLAVAVSLVFSYPLAFAGCRDGVLDLAKIPVADRTPSLQNKVTVACLSAITALALVAKDVTFVLSFSGATFGNALIYVFPALMFRKAVKDKGEGATKGLKREVKLAMGSAGLGIGMGLVGARMALKAAFG